jgi:hypothetical protein
MLPRHETPTRGRRTPCLPLDTGKLLRATRLGSQPAPDQQDNNIDSGKASFSSASPAWLTPSTKGVVAGRIWHLGQKEEGR